MKNFIIFGSPFIEKNEINEVVDTLKSGWIGKGPKVKIFEKNFIQYKKIKYACAVNSCTAALHLSLCNLHLNKNDEVLVPSLTFCSTVNAIIHAGGKPILIDVDFDTMNINPNEIEKKINKRTKCIIPVHFAGRPCNMIKISKIAAKYNLKIIEDCAHSVESQYHGKHIGTFGDYGCFSFYATKNLSVGEGGMIISNSKKGISRIKKMSLHGLSADAWKRYSPKGFKHYFVEDIGYKYNLTDIQASIGIHQLKKIEKNRKIRERIWKEYNNSFKNLPIKLPKNPEKNTKHSYHLYTIMIDKNLTGVSRDQFIDKMQKMGIGTGIHYLGIPEHPYYKKRFNWKINNFPNTKKIGRQTVSLPLSPKLNKKDISRIIKAVKNIIRNS